MRRLFLFLLCLGLVVSVTCLSGCWDRREINELAVVSALGIDKEDDIWKVTAEIFRPTSGGGNDGNTGGGGGTAERQAWVVQGQDYTILGALRDMALKVPRRVYAAHISAIIIGEEMARQGILEFLDLWERDAEARLITKILICRGRAEDVLVSSAGGLEKTVGLELAGLERFARINGHSAILSTHEFIALNASRGADPFTGVVELRSVPTIPTSGGTKTSSSPGLKEEKQKETIQALRLKGLALFKNDKLVGFAEPPEARGLLIMGGKVGNTVLHVRATDDNTKRNNTVALEVFKMKRQIKVEEKEGLPLVKIKITTELGLAEQAYSEDLTKAEANRFLEQQAATVIRNESEQAIELIQGLGVDPLGIGDFIRQQNKKLWSRLEKNWPEGLRDTEFSLDIQAKVRHSALIDVPPSKEQ